MCRLTQKVDDVSAQLKVLTELVQKAIGGEGGGGGGGVLPALNLHQALRGGVPGYRFHDFYLFLFILFVFIFTNFYCGFFYDRFHGSNGALEPCASPRKHGPLNGKDRLIDGAVETSGEGGDEPEIVYLSAA
jgi:hypothetical protein